MIKEVSDIKSVYHLMKQLRPNISLEQFVQVYDHAQKADDYKIYGYFESTQCLGIMGIRFLWDYVHLYHLYIDDLVTDDKARSKGVGAKLLLFAENIAREKKCTGLRLCTGSENKDGIRFYEREQWKNRALVFKKKL